MREVPTRDEPGRRRRDGRRIDWRDVVLATLAAAIWVSLVRPGPLSLPFFWDEADVYVPGARWVAEHGLTVTPGVFPDDYSRGHPPLLYLIAAVAFQLFGTSPTVGHLTVLPFTALALAGTFLLGATLFGRATGLAAALLLGTTPLFLSIGNMLLPEIPLTALTVLALLFFARGRLGWAVLCGVLMVWIKETGIFSAAAIGVGVLYDARGSLRAAATHKRIALATVPLFALLAFFAWQKLHAGYFVFPHHQNLFADRPLEWSNAWTVWPSLLGWHGRWLLAIAAALGLALGLPASHAAAIEPTSEPRSCPTRAAVVVAIVSLVLFNALFFSKMFWLERYALPAHPGLLVVLVGAALAGFGRLPYLARTPARWSAIGAAAFLGVAGLFSPTARDSEEHTFAYADVVTTHRAALARLDARDAPVLTTWPLTVALEVPYLGYVTRPLDSVHATSVGDGDPVGSVVVNSASSRAPALRRAARARGMRLEHTAQEGVAPVVEVYRPEARERSR